MIDYRTEYEKWINSPKVTDEVKAELLKIDEKDGYVAIGQG